MADFSFEKAAGGRVAGVDEVGRGPLAGPVVAAAVILERRRLPRRLYQLDDSKALSRPEREDLYAILVELAGRGGTVRIGIGAASVREIDRINILRASLQAMARAVRALGEVPDHALVDGNQSPTLPCRVQTVVKGDSLSLSIAAASIIAKVTRDRMMAALGRRYRGYGWETNVGYGTREHHEGLRRHGVTSHHRRSFAPVRLALQGVFDGFGSEFASDPTDGADAGAQALGGPMHAERTLVPMQEGLTGAQL